MFKLVFFCLVVVAFGSTTKRIQPPFDKDVVDSDAQIININFPWQISLLYYGSYICGGSIISNKFVLTAAHCAGVNPSGMTILAGASNSGSESTVYNVARVVRYPQYNSWTIDYDFALVEIVGTFALGTTQATVALPEQDEIVAAGTPAVCSGRGENTVVLLAIVDQASCNITYGGNITPRMICAGGQETCQANSGGPLVAENKLVGIVSWSRTASNYLGVFSRVAAVRQWINENASL